MFLEVIQSIFIEASDFVDVADRERMAHPETFSEFITFSGPNEVHFPLGNFVNQENFSRVSVNHINRLLSEQ